MLALVLSIIALIIIVMLFFQGAVIGTLKNLNPIYKAPPPDIANLENTTSDYKFSKVTYVLSGLGEPCKVTGTASRELLNLPYNYSAQGCLDGLVCTEGIYTGAGICQAKFLEECNSAADCADQNSCIMNTCQRFDPSISKLNTECIPGIVGCPDGYGCDNDVNLCKFYPEYDKKNTEFTCTDSTECYNISQTRESKCVLGLCVEAVPDGVSSIQASGRPCQFGSQMVNGFCQKPDLVDNDTKLIKVGGACTTQTTDQQCSPAGGAGCLFWKDTYSQLNTHVDENIRNLKDYIGVCGYPTGVLNTKCDSISNCQKGLTCDSFSPDISDNICGYDINKNICKGGTCASDRYQCVGGECASIHDNPCRYDSDCFIGTCEKTNLNLAYYVDSDNKWTFFDKNPNIFISGTDTQIDFFKYSGLNSSLDTINSTSSKNTSAVIYHKFPKNTFGQKSTAYVSVIDKNLLTNTYTNHVYTLNINIAGDVKLLDIKADSSGDLYCFYCYANYLVFYILFAPLFYSNPPHCSFSNGIVNVIELGLGACKIDTLDITFLNESPGYYPSPFFTETEFYNTFRSFNTIGSLVDTPSYHDFYFEFCSSKYSTPNFENYPEGSVNIENNVWDAVLVTCVILGASVSLNKTIVYYLFYSRNNTKLIAANYRDCFPGQDFFVYSKNTVFTSFIGLPSGPCYEPQGYKQPNNYSYSFVSPRADGGYNINKMNLINFDTVDSPEWSNTDSAIDFSTGIQNCYSSPTSQWSKVYLEFERVISGTSECGNITTFSPTLEYPQGTESWTISNIFTSIRNYAGYYDTSNLKTNDDFNKPKYLTISKVDGKNSVILNYFLNSYYAYYNQTGVWFNFNDINKSDYPYVNWRGLTFIINRSGPQQIIGSSDWDISNYIQTEPDMLASLFGTCSTLT